MRRLDNPLDWFPDEIRRSPLWLSWWKAIGFFVLASAYMTAGFLAGGETLSQGLATFGIILATPFLLTALVFLLESLRNIREKRRLRRNQKRFVNDLLKGPGFPESLFAEPPDLFRRAADGGQELLSYKGLTARGTPLRVHSLEDEFLLELGDQVSISKQPLPRGFQSASLNLSEPIFDADLLEEALCLCRALDQAFPVRTNFAGWSVPSGSLASER